MTRLLQSVLVVLLVTGCTSSTSQNGDTGGQIGENSAAQSVQIGGKPLHFDPQTIDELMIAKSDPVTGDRWLATFQRFGRNPSLWEISSPPSDQQVLDRKADEILLNHLVDSLNTLKVREAAPQGPLDSFGLEPPKFAIRGKSSQGSFEIFIGTEVKNNAGSYLTLDRHHVWVVQGSALRILDQIQSFQALRKQTWTGMTSDDVDEIEFIKKGKKLFYAQREGDRWTNRVHHQIKSDMNTFLTDVTTVKALQFIENPSQTTKLKKLIQTQALYEVQLSDRHGKMTTLKLRLQDNILYGLNSDRPSTVFVFHPNLLHSFDIKHP